MRRIIVILSVLLLNTITFGQPTNESALKEFNEFLGSEKATALDSAVASFERFLETNYPDADTRQDRYREFLMGFAQYNGPAKTLIFETERNAKIIAGFESTGLRKEIWVYGYESYESDRDFSQVLPPPEPKDSSTIEEMGVLHLDLIEDEIIGDYTIDSAAVAIMEKEWEERRRNSLYTNTQGDFLYGILKYAPRNSFAYDVARFTHLEGGISPGVVSHGFLENVKNFDDPFVKRLMVTEFYFRLMMLDIGRKT